MASIDHRPNKHSKKTWRARVRVKGFRDMTRSFDTRQEAETWAKRVEAQLFAGVDTVPDLSSELTLGEALDKYKEEETPHKKGSVQEIRRIEAWKQHPLAKLKLSLLTPQHFIAYRNERLKKVKKNTVRLDLSLISSLFKVAADEWGMPYLKNPVSLRKLSVSKGRDRRLNDEEAARFERELLKCRNLIVRLIVAFAMHTAARQGELLRLRREDVNLKRRTVIFRDTKNGDDRAVPLSRDAFVIIEGLLNHHDDELVFPITRDALVSAWRRILERAEIENFRFHDLRHEGTTRLFERGPTTMEVQKITGHKTLSMLVRYTQMNVDLVVDRLDATEPAKGLNRIPASAIAVQPTAAVAGRAEIDEELPDNVVPFRARR